MRLLQTFIAFIATTCLSFSTLAQTPRGTLPPPSRTVFKCEAGGKVTYSDEPCLGAKKLDVEPTRGLDSSSGRSMAGSDVQRERFREGLNRSIQPLTGKDTKQMDVERKRMNLPAQSKAECLELDSKIFELERQEALATNKAQIQSNLYERRLRYRQLGC